MSRLIDVFAVGTTKFFQPDQTESGQNARDLGMQERLSKMVGFVAFLLPVVLLLGVIQGTCFRDSISHFYYAQFLGSVFVGALIFIGGFMIAYRGETWAEDWGSNLAGAGACAVALFPTIHNGCESESEFLSRVFVRYTADGNIVSTVPERDYFQLFQSVENWHAVGAGAVFLFLGFYCFVVLTRVVESRHMVDGRLTPVKRNRNIIYRICGILIFLSVGILGFVGWKDDPDLTRWWNSQNLTFWIEVVALWSFGFAWTVKGRALPMLRDRTMKAG